MALLTASCARAQDQGASSVYTTLAEGQCTLETEVKETGSTLHRCPGAGGWGLLVADDDARMSVIVLSPKGVKYPLNYWDVITTGFSTLGPRAEWRVLRRDEAVEPFALIVRVNAKEGEAGQQKSYLAVARIGPDRTCVIARIEPGPGANEAARKAADGARGATCLPPLP
jgi:hypothetical protein